MSQSYSQAVSRGDCLTCNELYFLMGFLTLACNKTKPNPKTLALYQSSSPPSFPPPPSSPSQQSRPHSQKGKIRVGSLPAPLLILHKVLFGKSHIYIFKKNNKNFRVLSKCARNESLWNLLTSYKAARRPAFGNSWSRCGAVVVVAAAAAVWSRGVVSSSKDGGDGRRFNWFRNFCFRCWRRQCALDIVAVVAAACCCCCRCCENRGRNRDQKCPKKCPTHYFPSFAIVYFSRRHTISNIKSLALRQAARFTTEV